MANNAILLGDSVFDNRAYTDGAPDVAEHLRQALGAAWAVTALSVDGTTTTDIGPQLDKIPQSATQLCLSLGGNDALLNADLLGTPVPSTADALDLFATRLDAFDERYRWVLDALTERKLPLLVCTIYEADLGEQSRRGATALRMFNDVIVRAALAAGANILDLRTVCDQPSDFVNGIEPSGPAGRNIAQALASAMGDTPAGCRLFGAP